MKYRLDSAPPKRGGFPITLYRQWRSVAFLSCGGHLYPRTGSSVFHFALFNGDSKVCLSLINQKVY